LISRLRILALFAILAVVAMTGISKSDQPSALASTLPTPISQYKFDELTGTTTVSDSIRGQTGEGTVVGSPTFSSGVDGNAMCLDDRLEYAYAPVVGNGLTEFTVAAWVKLDSYTTWGTIVKNWGSTQVGALHFGLNGSTHEWSNFVGESGTTNAVAVVDTKKATLNQWQYVVSTVSQTAGEMTLYVDGASPIVATFSSFAGIAQAGPLMAFGQKLEDFDSTASPPTGTAPAANDGHLNGCIDELTFWGSALTATQINGVISSAGPVNSPQVTFDASGGTGTMANQTSSSATNLTPNSFTRSGFTFAGWATSAGDASAGTVSYLDQASFPFTASATLYAVWNVIGEVTFDANGGTGTMVNQTSSSATNLTPNSFTRSGFTFTGWASSKLNADSRTVAYVDEASFPFTSSATLFAVWTAMPQSSQNDSSTASAEPPITSPAPGLAATGASPMGGVLFGALVLVVLGVLLLTQHRGKKAS
jgi:hypothetical protein